MMKRRPQMTTLLLTVIMVASVPLVMAADRQKLDKSADCSAGEPHRE